MILRNRFLAKRYMTLRTNEVRIFLSLGDLEIQRAAFVYRRGGMTSFGSAA